MHDAPADPRTLRAEADALIAAGDAGARAVLARLWAASPDPATAPYIVGAFAKLKAALPPDRLPLAPCRVAILRSFTVEPAVPMLRAGALVGGIDATVHVGEFNAYAQELLDPAGPLYRFEPTVVILAVQTRDIVPELWDGAAGLEPGDLERAAERVVASFRSWIAALRRASKAALVIHTLEVPAHPAGGILDAQEPVSQGECIRRINRELAVLAREHAGVYLLDYDALASRRGKDLWTDERKWRTVRLPIAAGELLYLAREWVRYLHPICGRVAKCLVVDLDNTLWGGVIGEDGMDGIRLDGELRGAPYQALQRAILDLYHRGIILAIASKNNEADALEAIRTHAGMVLRPDHFAALRINWNDKATSLREIARELNIGIDSLAFLDDNPVERRWVAGQLPEVTVIELPADPMRYAAALRECPVFERLTLSSEDRQRGRMYAEQRLRAELEQAAGTIEEFYRSLAMEMEIERLAPVPGELLTRVAQLTQKTNQFNLTTRRYTEQQVLELAATPATSRVYWTRLKDRFGDNGVIGVAILKLDGTVCEIDTLLLSCRVIGRTVETAFLAHLVREARAMGASTLSGWFLPTKKNAPCREYYRSQNLTLAREEDGGRQLWQLDLASADIPWPPWIARVSGARDPAAARNGHAPGAPSAQETVA